MKKLLLLTLSFFLCNGLIFAQGKLSSSQPPTKENTTLDNADMKTYVMVFLMKGEKRNQSKKEAEEIQQNHLAHLTQMHQEGILLMAGPFMDEQDIKGILVMNTSEIEQAKQVVENDPAIIAGRLKAVYHLWYTKSGQIILP